MTTDKLNIPIRRSFLGKLLLFMLLIGILPVLINAVVSYILAQNALNTATRETQKIIEADQSTYLLSWANERTQDIGTLAGIARISSMDPVTANEAIKQYFRYWGMYETIFLAGPDGKTIATSDDKPLDVSDRLYFSEALSGSVTLSEPLLSKASGHLVIVFASPVRSKSGDIVGVIGETVPLDTLAQLLDKNRSGLTSESYLVNQQGYFVTAPRFVNEMKTAGLITDRAELEYQLQTTASKELQAGKSGQGIYTNYLGEEVIGQYTWLPDIKLGLISEKQTSEANAATTQLAIFSVIMIVVSIVLVSLIAFIFSRGITKPVKLMVDISNHLAMGDIDQKLEYKSQDEFGLLADSIREIVGYQKEMSSAANAISTGILTYDVRPKSDKDELGNAFSKMIAGLRETIGLVAQSASAITSAASQLTTAAEQSGEATSQIATTIQQVALGTAQQTEGVTKTSASVEQMGRAIDGVAKGAQEQAKAISQASQITSRINAAIEQVAANAQAVTRDSAQAATYSRDGAKTVKETITGMEAIRSKVGLSATKVEEMGTRSEEIGAIVETIEDIASQTNLLALNAAIEAARAGEQGKGFAVVADEGPQTGERSSLATKEIAAPSRASRRPSVKP
ncbi:methyl-accepting chemotaxis protein [Candidatus Villigracilis saccharophilus]|uniref:methyl-accepting chemotaxis protein n=1 Tax=Candidatus Villigracilis saccharophilus TaxID=3140684 RepID=UPI003136179A|nr:HAMP domain-containing protein [Anaerolineales bacterium]